MNPKLKKQILETVRKNTVQVLSHGYIVSKPPLKITIIRTDDQNCNDYDYDDIDDLPFVTYELTVCHHNQIIETIGATAYTGFSRRYQNPQWYDVHNIYCAMEKKVAMQKQVRAKSKQNIIQTILNKFRPKTR